MQLKSRSTVLGALALGLFFSLVSVSPSFAHGGETTVLPNGQCLFIDSHIGDCPTDAAAIAEPASAETGTDVTATIEPRDGALTETPEATLYDTGLQPEPRGVTVDGATATSDPSAKGGKTSLMILALLAFTALAAGVVLRPLVGKRGDK